MWAGCKEGLQLGPETFLLRVAGPLALAHLLHSGLGHHQDRGWLQVGAAMVGLRQWDAGGGAAGGLWEVPHSLALFPPPTHSCSGPQTLLQVRVSTLGGVGVGIAGGSQALPTRGTSAPRTPPTTAEQGLHPPPVGWLPAPAGGRLTPDPFPHLREWWQLCLPAPTQPESRWPDLSSFGLACWTEGHTGHPRLWLLNGALSGCWSWPSWRHARGTQDAGGASFLIAAHLSCKLRGGTGELQPSCECQGLPTGSWGRGSHPVRKLQYQAEGLLSEHVP